MGHNLPKVRDPLGSTSLTIFQILFELPGGATPKGMGGRLEGWEPYHAQFMGNATTITLLTRLMLASIISVHAFRASSVPLLENPYEKSSGKVRLTTKEDMPGVSTTVAWNGTSGWLYSTCMMCGLYVLYLAREVCNSNINDSVYSKIWSPPPLSRKTAIWARRMTDSIEGASCKGGPNRSFCSGSPDGEFQVMETCAKVGPGEMCHSIAQ